jgi:DNA (cytosine-5)-methyltransferase 1
MDKVNKQLTFIDLFAGAGGLSEGFIRSGYKPLAHIEMDLNACFTLQTRLSYHWLKSKRLEYVYHSYLLGEITRDELYSITPDNIINSVINKKISEDTVQDILSDIDNLIKSENEDTVDVLIGGPPCQAFSLIGRKVNQSKKETDERIHYYKLYAKFLSKYKPKVFVFENVVGLKSYNNGILLPEVKRVLSDEDYKVEYKILNSANFGVLQNRRRIIIIGWLKDLNFIYPEFDKTEGKYIVNDLLKDLPALKPGEEQTVATYISGPTQYLIDSEIRNGLDFTVQHIARPHNENDRDIYRTAIRLWNKNKKRLKYSELDADLITHENVESFLDRFKVVAKDLSFCHTLIAHIAKDGHYYIHPSLKQARSLSVREAARIQSFPDDYFFEGRRTNMLTQIGNAVPPLMAKSIAQKILGLL